MIKVPKLKNIDTVSIMDGILTEDEFNATMDASTFLKVKPYKLSPAGIAFLMKLESVEYELYFDSGGLPTIGVGHLLSDYEYTYKVVALCGLYIDITEGLTYDECTALLKEDLVRFEKVVNNEVKEELTQNKYDALVIFAFNVGTSAFKSSTLLKELNKGNFAEVPNQMMRWVYVKGEKSSGLINRRTAEKTLWETNKYKI